MEAIKLPIVPQPDIIVTNNQGKIVLIVEAKAKKLQTTANYIAQLKSYLSNLEQEIGFAMLVDLEKITIFKVKELKTLIWLKTVDILKYYDAEFPAHKIFDLYFITLLEAWLRDLAYHWKSVNPPGSEELVKIGLLGEIEGGDTYSQNDQ